MSQVPLLWSERMVACGCCRCKSLDGDSDDSDYEEIIECYHCTCIYPYISSSEKEWLAEQALFDLCFSRVSPPASPPYVPSSPAYVPSSPAYVPYSPEPPSRRRSPAYSPAYEPTSPVAPTRKQNNQPEIEDTKKRKINDEQLHVVKGIKLFN